VSRTFGRTLSALAALALALALIAAPAASAVPDREPDSGAVVWLDAVVGWLHDLFTGDPAGKLTPVTSADGNGQCSGDCGPGTDPNG
jgi:hypothetical protein